MSQEELFINGELLRLRREARGWVLNDMATRACMSVKQIRQLEEGGMSAFYSLAVKATAAKKVGALLGLSADEVFAQDVSNAVVEELVETEELIADVPVEALSTSEASEISLKPTEPAPAQIEPIVSASNVASDSKDDVPSSKGTLWLIVILLGIAFAVAAYLRPNEEPVLAEPAPPIQALPADVVDPASAASATESSASTAEVVVAPASTSVVSQKSASATVLNSSASIGPAASSVRLAAPAVSATPVARAASAPALAPLATPATSAASKAP